MVLMLARGFSVGMLALVGAGRGGRSRAVAAALCACVCALCLSLVMGVAPSLAASAGGGVFGPLVAPGVSPALVGGGDPSFGEPGEGAGQIGSPHGISGGIEVVSGLAVDHVTGDVYVADAPNHRIDEFKEDGTFVRAWGWGVDKAQPEAKLQECTTVSGCQKGEAGGGAGEFSESTGIAVDGEAGHEAVFVLESGLHGGNDRVQAFSLAGAFVTMWGGHVNKQGGNVCAAGEAAECQAGSEGSGGGEFSAVGRQGAIAVGPMGLVYVGDYRQVQWFSPAGKAEGSFEVTGTAEEHEMENVEALTVTSGGSVCLTVNVSSFYAQSAAADEVLCYSATGTLEHSIALEEQKSGRSKENNVLLAADGAGHLFVDQYLPAANNASGETVQVVYEYSETGQQLERLLPPGGEPGSEGRAPGGFALNESAGAASGVLVVSRPEAVVRSEALPPPGPLVLEESAQPATAGCLKLTAAIDPEGAQTTYKFAYGTETPPGKTTAEATIAGEGFKLEKVSVTQCGLTPETPYRYYAIAENANDAGQPAKGVEQSAETGPALKIDGLWSAGVSESGALLEAEIDPAGVDSEYHFEYAPAAGGSYTALPSTDIGAGTGDVRVAAHIGGLTAHTAYVYRVVAHNAVGNAKAEAEFTTQRAGAAPGLLDSRLWEQVSPPQKHSATILLRRAGGSVEATPAGEKITYYAVTASEADPQGEPTPVSQQIISTRGAAGWQSKGIASPNSQRPSLKSSSPAEYWLFSTDLERSVVEPNPFTALSQWTVGQERTPYVRDEAKCPASTVSLEQLQASECFTPLLADTGPFADVGKTVEYGGPRTNNTGLVSAIAATPDLSHVVLKSTGAELEKNASSGALYEWDAGKLVAISVTPAGTVCNGTLGVQGGFGSLGLNSRNALAPDGSLAVWGGDLTSGECAGHVYVRDTRKAITVQADEVRGGSGEGSPEAVYQDASVDDEHAFFIDSQRLTADSTGTQSGVNGANATNADLYEYAFDPASDTGSLVDISVPAPAHAGEAAGVQGVLGVSEDGSLVYAVAHGVLSEEENTHHAAAKAGEDNLYLFEHVNGTWRVRFIATLAGKDANDWQIEEGGATARVSPDGRWLAFMSDRSLTGYDNRDRVSGTPDEEVFLFDQSAGRLVCASCNPTGARPSGMEITGTGSGVAPLIDSEFQFEEGLWLSGVLPVRYASGLSGKVGVYQPRYLSDGGRLFFDSTEALVPQDTNGTADVYEYEPPANGEVAASDDCGESSPTFSHAADGCIDLVSGGSASTESVFVEASENGNDVFFETAAKLASSDIDTAYDLYDAHSCGAGASWACASPPPVSTASCEAAESCRPGSASQPPGPDSPASATFEGAGNLTLAPRTAGTDSKTVKRKMTASCAKGEHRSHGKCVRTKPMKRKRRAKGSRAGARTTSEIRRGK
jgi:hypothetical protein